MRVRQRAEKETVAELKKTLTALGYTQKFTYMRKDELVTALIDLKEKSFVKDPDLGRGSMVSSNPKKRKHHERSDADESNRALELK